MVTYSVKNSMSREEDVSDGSEHTQNWMRTEICGVYSCSANVSNIDGIR